MARPPRLNIPGGVYHVMARGIDRNAIYLDDHDRTEFLDTLRGVIRRYGWECLAYCLMGNHYHLVLRTPQPNLSRGMGVVNGSYASWFNDRHERVGPVFQGRFRSVLVRDSTHLRVTIRYVLRNPLIAGLCQHAGEWRWSSYGETVADDRPGLVTQRATLAWWGEESTATGLFACFVDSESGGLRDGDFGDDVALPCEPLPSIRPPLEELLSRDPGAAAAAEAHNRHGYSLAEIATALGLSKSSVGRMLVAYDAEMMRSASTWEPRRPAPATPVAGTTDPGMVDPSRASRAGCWDD